MKKTVDLIKDFIFEIKKEYNDLTLNYIYDSEEDFYEIWHDNYELNNDDQFLEVVGRNLGNIIYGNNIYTISFGYDFEKAEEFKSNKFRYPAFKNRIDIGVD